jgi:co-chaperonin GroES (HSP10)
MNSVTKLRTKLVNKSGIYPAANRVLVKPDPIDDPTKNSVIEMPEAVRLKYEQGQATGRLIAVGPDAFSHITERVYHIHDNRDKEFIEERIRGYSEPFAEVGERIAFAKYSGLRVKGEDNETYIIINDEDITAKVSDAVEFTDLDTRKGFGSDN